jgi:hypothetical protein
MTILIQRVRCTHVIQLIVLIHVIILNIKNKRFIIKLVKFHVTSGVVTKLFLLVKKGGLIYLKY